MPRHVEPGLAAANALAVAGNDLTVDCLDGELRRYVNLDSAASTPALERVADAVAEFVPWYSSVHRGAGTKSQVSTAAFEGARQAVRDFVVADADQEVVFVANTTHAINLLAALHEPGTKVLASPFEHHANMLPWRSLDVELLPFATCPEELLELIRAALVRNRGEIELIAVTGASNVTGEVWPLKQLADLAHDHGAEIFVDAAQLAPHRAIDLRDLGVDHLALSGHKLYAPFGAGALISRRHRLAAAEPWMRGGGAVRSVTLDGVAWADLPDRHEAGSPNTIGAVALGVACDALAAVGMDVVAEHERLLAERLRAGLARVDGLDLLHMWPDGSCDRVGVTTFVLQGYPDRLLAQILAAEHAIGVRNGRFCAHPLVAKLMELHYGTGQHPPGAADGNGGGRLGAVRASLGVANRAEDVDRLVAALTEVMDRGPVGHYVWDPSHNEYRLTHDHRAWPTLRIRLKSGPHVATCGAS